MFDGMKAIKGSFLIGLLLVMVYIIEVILYMLLDLGIYLEYYFYTNVIIFHFTNVFGVVFLLSVLRRVIKADDIHVRRVMLIFFRIGVVIVILPTVYYILIRLGFFWYCNFSLVILVVRVFNYFYLLGIILLVSSFILLLRDN